MLTFLFSVCRADLGILTAGNQESESNVAFFNGDIIGIDTHLVGGLEHIFSIYWE